MTDEGKRRYGIDYSTVESRNGDYVYSRHEFGTSKGATSARNQIDRYAKDMDYDSAYDFDRIGEGTLRAFKKNGKEEAFKYLYDNLKDYEYKYTVHHEKYESTGENTMTYVLSVFGNKNIYNVSGDGDYSDDQYFEKRR